MGGDGLIGRRRFIQGGLAAVALTGPARLAAELPPSVDRLAATFVVDGAVFGLAQPSAPPGLLIEPPPRMARVEQRLAAEWGLSLLLETETDGSRAAMMLDFGYSPETLANNMRILGVDPAGLGALVLSHGHYDHFGGLPALLRSGRLRHGVPLYIGGGEALCRRLRGLEGDLDFGQVDRAAIEAAHVDLRIAAQPMPVAGGTTTGTIPLRLERPGTPTRMLPGSGCRREEVDRDKRRLDVVQDDSRHELGLAFNVADLGLVVFGACSHRGILNTVRRAQEVTGVARIHAIVGGFHLVPPQTQDDAERTARAMAALDPAFVIPGHCSGEAFIAAATAAMPGKVIRPYVGSKFTFARSL